MFALLFHEVTGGLLLGELLNSFFLVEFGATGLLLEAHLLFVGLDQFLFHLHGSLLPGHLAGLFTFEVLVGLAFDEFAFEHFGLQILDVLKFELFELIRDALRVINFVFILHFQLGLHLDIIFGHLSLLHLVKLNVNVFLDCLLPLGQ